VRRDSLSDWHYCLSACPQVEGLDDLVAQRRTSHDAVGFVGGSMHDALRTARRFVTVSSTAALEAMAMVGQP